MLVATITAEMDCVEEFRWGEFFKRERHAQQAQMEKAKHGRRWRRG